jgi:hypothetical protein
VERSAKTLRNPVLTFDGGGDAVAVWSRDEDALNASQGLPYNTMHAARYDHDAPADPNLLYNDGFESDLAEWNTSGSSAGVTLTREAGGHSGDWAAKLTNTATSTGGCTLNDSPFIPLTTAPGTYTATLWVRGETAGQTLRLRLREYSGSTLAGTQSTSVTLTTSWQQLTVSYTPATAGTTLDFNAYIAGAPPGTCFLADDAAISKT